LQRINAATHTGLRFETIKYRFDYAVQKTSANEGPMATNKTETAEIIAELAELYPGAFSTDPSLVRPLAIGVKEMLLQQCKLSPKSIGDALRRYTGSTGYLKATVEGAARVDLDGQAAGTVTMCQAEHAQRRLAKIAERVTIKPKATTLAAAKPAGAAKGSVNDEAGREGKDHRHADR
jgi:ProP effector